MLDIRGVVIIRLVFRKVVKTFTRARIRQIIQCDPGIAFESVVDLFICEFVDWDGPSLGSGSCKDYDCIQEEVCCWRM